ncbi:MAG: carboxypeptidase regulatory-like domain-containing protein [Bryobacteraceae bacterium]
MSKTAFLTAALAAALPLAAQISTGALVGTVKDASNAVVAGARVEAKNTATGAVRSTTTDGVGEYSIPNLPAARYNVTVTMQGFKTFSANDVALQVAQRLMLDARLEVGAVGQELTVTGAAPLIDTATSSVGQVVNTEAVEHMPLNGRSFWQLTQLTPGVNYTPGGQGTRTGGRSIRSSAVNVTINGTGPTWTGWSLDGANITEMQTGGTLIQPNVDAIQEFKVESSNMPAEYGHTPTVVNATLRSGGNQFHGTLFEFVRNDKFDARNFFYIPPAGSKQSKDPLRRNQYGGTFGGPIRKDKTFFFLDLERTSVREGQDFNNVVPTAAQRTGDFSSLLAQARPATILDPLTRAPYPGNIIPANRVSPQGQFFAKYLPLPNQVVGGVSRAILTNNLSLDQNRADIRIDQQVGSKTQLMGRYSINDNTEQDPNPFPTLGAFDLHSRAQNAIIGATHTVSPRWIADGRVSYYRSIFLFGPTLGGTNFNGQAGVKGFDDLTSTYSFPQITMTNYATFTGSPSDQRPKSNRIRNWQSALNLSYAGGRHSAKFGADFMHQTAGFYNGSRSVGIFNFVGNYTGNAFADFLTGYPDSVTRDYFKQLNGNFANFWSFYAQDSFRVTQNFTLNFGMRMELNPFYSGIRGQKSAFDLVTGKLVIPSTIDPAVQPLTAYMLPIFRDRFDYTRDRGLPDDIHGTDLNWGPRAGFAWRPFGRSDWVVRTAYGIFYVFPDSNTIDNTVATVPFVATQTVFNDRPPVAPTRTWGDFFLGQPAVAANPNPGRPCPFGMTLLSCSQPDVDSGALHFSSTYLQQWNISIQHQISANTSFDLAYVGNKTTHMNQNINRNDPLPGPGAIQGRRPYPQWGALIYPVFEENGNYNSFQAKFEARNFHGLNMLGAYTFSKCIDYTTNESGAPTFALWRYFRGLCDSDLPHMFSGSFDYQLPVGRGKALLGSARGVMNQVVGGWSVAGIVTMRSGLPFSPTISSDTANTGVGGQKPDVIGKPTMVRDPTCWFYVAANAACGALAPGTADAFALPPAQVRYGTGGRNILRSDGLSQIDLTVMKVFPITETKQVEFRSEFFNAFNHPTFAAPGTNVNAASGAQVASTLNAGRIIQFALKLRF